MSYQNGKIYRLKSNQTDKVYYGSTKQTLNLRLSGHKNHYKRYINGTWKSYVSSFEIMQYDDAYIELVEHYPCNSKQELLKREGEIIKQNECVNKIVAGRTQKEYQEDNKEQIKKQRQEYYQQNRDKIEEKKKQYNESHKEEIQDWKHNWYEENKGKTLERVKQNYEKNKETLKVIRNKKYTCICGCQYSYANKTQHEKSLQHHKFLEHLGHLQDCNVDISEYVKEPSNK